MKDLKRRIKQLEQNIGTVIIKEKKLFTPDDWTSEELSLAGSLIRADAPIPEDLCFKIKNTAWPNRTAGLTEAERRVLLEEVINDLDEDPADDLDQFRDKADDNPLNIMFYPSSLN